MTVEHTPSPYGPRDGSNRGGKHLNEPHWEDEYFPEAEEDVDVADLLLAMERLTERQRFVVECRFGLRAGAEGHALGVREIARLLGVHHSTVEEHERAGLRQLRLALGRDNNPSP